MDEIEEIAKLHPDVVAVYSPHRQINFAQLTSGLWSAAANLASFGIRAGDRVGLLIENKFDHLFVSLALARMGASHLAFQIGSNSADLSELEIRLGLKAMVLDRDVDAGLSQKIMLRNFQIRNVQPDEKDTLRAHDGNLGWLILKSSGTTGAPKYSILTHEQTQVRSLQTREHYGYALGDKNWCSPDISYVMTKIRSMTTLKVGVTSCFIPNRTPYESIVQFLNSTKVDFGYITAFDLHSLISVGRRLRTFRAIEATSGVVSKKSSLQFMQEVNENLWIAYATNEAGTISWKSVSLEDSQGSIVGEPAPYISIQIVDKTDRQVEQGTIGQIRVKGPSVIQGYIDNSEANTEAFSSGWFYPGDLGSINDAGELIFHGRIDDMMIFNGINIYPAEIEDALSAHVAIKDCCAFGLRHEVHQDIPLAAVVRNSSVTEIELLEHCRRILGSRSPKRIIFVDAIPRTSNGKALRRDLVSLAKQQLD